jgi:hypothetical protein
MIGALRRRLTGRPDAAWVVLLFLAAALPRLLLVLVRRTEPIPSEMTNVAWTLASSGYLGDPYGVATGPSAHIAPGYPFLLAQLMRVAGGREQGIFLGQILSALVVSLCIAFLPIVARRLGLPRAAGIVAALALIPPIFVFIETASEWETPFIVAAMMLCLSMTLPVLFAARFDVRRGAALGVLWGASCLVAPLLAPVCVAVHALALVRWRDRWRRYLSYLATLAAVSVLVLAPYLVRIQRELHGFAFVRSNFGLELAVSNNDSARVTLDDNIKRGGGMSTHPFQSAREAARVRAVGELAYNRVRMAEAQRWIEAHPLRFVRLTAERFALFWVPRSKRIYQRVLFAFVFAGAVGFYLTRGRWRSYPALTLAAATLAYASVYAVVQTDARYSYPVLWLHTLLASTFLLERVGLVDYSPLYFSTSDGSRLAGPA